MNKRITFGLLLLTVIALVGTPVALSLPSYATVLQSTYGSGLSCGTCHVDPNGGGPRNAYGSSFEAVPTHNSDPTGALCSIGAPTGATTNNCPTTTPTSTGATPTPTSTPVLTTINVSPATATLDVNGTQTFTAAAYDQLSKLMDAIFNWTSSNTTVGTIDNTGLFTAKALGTTTITAASGDVNGTASVSVTAASTSPPSSSPDDENHGYKTYTPAQVMSAIQPYMIPENAINPDPMDTSYGEGQVYIYKLPTNPAAYVFTSSGAIACDGVSTTQCNTTTDPAYSPDTAFHTSTDQPLDAASLPFYVLPVAGSSYFDYTLHSIDGGEAGLVLYNENMNFGVLGDEDANEQATGEMSYAMASSLGINPDPAKGGIESGVTYIVFTSKANVVSPIEDHTAADTKGESALDTMMSQLNATVTPNATALSNETVSSTPNITESPTTEISSDGENHNNHDHREHGDNRHRRGR